MVVSIVSLEGNTSNAIHASLTHILLKAFASIKLEQALPRGGTYSFAGPMIIRL
jgi:hypothetical protein